MNTQTSPATRNGWSVRGIAALVAASVFASVDTVLVRREFGHRPVDFELFLQSWGLWGVYCALAILPALWSDRLLARFFDARRFHAPARVGARQAAWGVAPVLVHQILDRYTRVGGDTSGLIALEPWLLVAGVATALALAAFAIGWLSQRIPAGAWAASVTLIAVACGRLVEFRPTPPPVVAPASSERPNVLLLVWDTARANSLSLYGYDRETTPQLAEFASRATLFTQARSVSVYTLSSHVSMLTGVYPSHHGARVVRQRFNPFKTPSVAEDFRRAGYRTAAFVGTDVLRAQSGVAHGFEVYDDQVDPWVTYTSGWALLHDLQSAAGRLIPALRQNGLPHWIQDFQRPGEDVLRDANDWLANGDQRPWFCMINLYDVHWPYLPERWSQDKWVEPYEGIVDGYSHRGDRVKLSNYALDEHDKQHVAQLYDAELHQLDRLVDQFLGELDLDSTAVVLCSDHGEALGEGERFEHADLLDCQTRIPMLVRVPGQSEGRIVEAPVGGVDVAPTLLALGQLPPREGMYGRNLLGELPADHALLVEDRDHGNRNIVRVALWDGPWKLVRHGVPPEFTWYLYDAHKDPIDAHDVAAEHPEVVARLRTKLEGLRTQWDADGEHALKALEIANQDALEALGYMGGATNEHGTPHSPAPASR